MSAKAEGSGESLEQVIRDLQKGKLYPCYLLYGEDEFLIKEALRHFVDILIPAGDRDFNFFSLDGEEIDTDSLCETLQTSPLLPGRKVVVVHRAPFFLSRQTAADIIQKVREHLDTDPLRAGRDFLTFLTVAGWNLDDFKEDGWKKITDDEWFALVDGEAGHQREQWLPKVVAYCVQQGLKVRKAVDEADQLMQTLVSGLPEGHCLVLTAAAVDKRKRLFKTISDLGRIIYFPQTKGETRQKAQLLTASKTILSSCGKFLTDGAWALLGEKTGYDLQNSMSALEKLILHAGDRKVINEQDVADLIGKTKEDTVFNLTAAMAEKNATLCLSVLNELIVKGIQPLVILAMLTREVRFLLQAKILFLHAPLHGFDARMDYNAFQGRIYPKIKTMAASSGDKDRVQIVELAGSHPYVIFNTLKNAGRFSYEALLECLDRLAESDLQIKTSAKNPRLLLERFLLAACSA